MAEEERLEAVITLVDDYTDQVQDIIERTKEMKQLVENINPKTKRPKDNISPTMQKIKKIMNSVKKMKADPKVALKNGIKAAKNIKKIRKELLLLAAKRIALNIKNNALKSIGKLGQKIKSIVKKRWEARIGVKDRASGVLGKIKGLLSVLAAGVVISATIKKGSELEQQKVSMEHFMGVGNKDKSQAQIKGMTNAYIKNLRKNANETPFDTGDVIKAGTRALTISGGNTKDSMRLVKLAEDMAASDPNKTIGDAIEALADAKMGEFERMKEFGFKGSKEKLDAAGGDFFKMTSEDGKTVDDIFGGLAAKQAKTASGLFSTIKGNISSVQQNIGTGILEGLKPTLGEAVGFFSKLGDDAGLELGKKIGGGLSDVFKGVSGLVSNINFGEIFSTLKDTLSPAIDLFKDFFYHITNKTPEAQAVMKVFGSVVNLVFAAMKPIIQIAAKVIREVFKFIIKHSKQIQSVLKATQVVWQSCWSIIKVALKVAWAVMKPILSTIVSMIGGVADAINAAKRAWQNFKKAISGGATVNVKTNVPGENGFMGGVSSGSGRNNRKPKNKPRRRRAFGQARVPYNNYLTKLHEGERVLTKQEANRMDRKKTDSDGITFNIFGMTVREEADIDLFTERFIKKWKLVKAGGVK